MPAVESLRDQGYHGIILETQDPKQQGRYKVHIPELHQHRELLEGIWCKNQIHKWRWGPSDDYMYGQYFPLQPGTKVVVKFYEDDYHTGYIDKIISDQVQKTQPKIGCGLNPESTTDRDDMYILYKTPKKHNLFTILEETKDSANGLTKELIPNSIHMYFNYHRTTLAINEDGIHWFTQDNRGVTVEGNNSEWVQKNEKVYVKQNRDVYIDQNEKHYVAQNSDKYIGQSSKEYAGSELSVMAGQQIAYDAPFIYLNCGKAKQAKQAVTNKGEDEIIVQNKLDMRTTSHQKRDDTYYGISGKGITSGVGQCSSAKLQGTPGSLAKGGSSRQSTVGADQTGDTIIAAPAYPQRSVKSPLQNSTFRGALQNRVASQTSITALDALGQPITAAKSVLSDVENIVSISDQQINDYSQYDSSQVQAKFDELLEKVKDSVGVDRMMNHITTTMNLSESVAEKLIEYSSSDTLLNSIVDQVAKKILNTPIKDLDDLNGEDLLRGITEKTMNNLGIDDLVQEGESISTSIESGSYVDLLGSDASSISSEIERMNANLTPEQILQMSNVMVSSTLLKTVQNLENAGTMQTLESMTYTGSLAELQAMSQIGASENLIKMHQTGTLTKLSNMTPTQVDKLIAFLDTL